MVRQQMLPWILAAALAPALPVVSTAQQDSEWLFTVRIQTLCANALTAEPPPEGASLVVPVGVPVAFKAVPSVPDTTFLWTPGAALCGGKPRSQTWNLPVLAQNSSVVVVVFPQAGKYPLTVQATTRDAQRATASVTVLVAGEDATAPDGSYLSPPAPQPPYGGDPGDPFRFSPPQAYGTTTGEASVTVDAPPYLAVNKDDDSNDEYWDIDDRETPVAAEDDLRPVVLVASGGTTGGKVTLAITDKKRCLGGILWKDAKKRSKMDEREWSVQSGEVLIKQFFLEGWLPSDSVGEVKVSASLAPEGGGSASLTATDKTTVFEVDIDIDSDNQDGFNAEFVATEEEDQIEASPTLKRDLCTGLVGSRSERYGKIVFESGFQDADGDGVPDFADGFGLAMADFPAWTNPDPVAVGADVRFVPVQIVLPRPYNPDNTQIEISCATVPASVPRDGEGLAKLVATAPDGTQSPAGYQLKTPGIRLWRCPPADRASGVNVPAGDYVPMGCKIAWNDLSKAPTYYRMATLYLEFVDDRADSTLAGTHRLKVQARQSNGPTTEDEVAFTLAVARLAVDYNRDGTVAFDASDRPNARKPFRFWVNDDRDVEHFADANGLTDTLVQDDVNEGPADCMDDKISLGRDLEDFCRLHVETVGLGQEFGSGKLQMKLEWAHATEEPVLNAFRSYQEKGNTLYLFNDRESQAQIISQDYGTAIGRATRHSPLQLPTTAWSEKGGSWAKACLLFEGASKGKGALRLAVYQGERRLAPASGLWLQLCGIKEMYQRWNATEASRPGIDWDAWPLANYQRDADSPDPDEGVPRSNDEKDFILFVHGWNMDSWEKRTSAETAYKRMWHLGYQGRFGAFFWPTFYSPGLGCLDPRHFDGSEQRAWNSSDALLGLLTDLNQQYPGRLHLVAHSMGNVVAAEALRKAPSPIVENYIASQGALAADVYRLNPDMTWRWPRILQETVPAKMFQKLPPLTPRAVTTPNVYAFYPKDGRSDVVRLQQDPKVGEPYMCGARGAKNWFNYFNANDWALGLWIFNQSLKPNGPDSAFLKALLGRTLALEYQTVWDQEFHVSYAYERFFDNRWGFYAKDARNDTNSRGLYTPENTYEIFSYCAQARCNPMGRQSNLGAQFIGDKGKDRQCDWNAYGSDHPGHSAQFRHTIATMFPFWEALLADCMIRHLKPVPVL